MSTRDRLVESTRELLRERGYVGTSPKAIQQRADAGQGSMYHHFAGKQDLALAAIERNAEDLTALASEELSSPGAPVERIATWLRREREVLRGCPMGVLVQDPEIIASDTLRSPIAEHFEWLRGRLREILAEDGLDVRLADTLLAVLQGGYVLARAANSTEPFGDAVEGAIALLERATAD
ncbi:TetR/AcrR family transcriptional regulator [Kutzneria kofuensis]|uniref:AcrR family transcriptional regulator n=1 Tax=Kutzneria kofuensis TaxID=103725 RepID=A0A7W9KTE5_9PSEU|nr:TetR/AcrR family transcriptional regulator [Kutzneria kofuensis]MBB5897619.1 AcrR family transcriptional regulator [Kutzneria kofuensis]